MFFLSDQEVTDALEMALRSFQEQESVEIDGEDETDGGNECDDVDDDEANSDADDWSKILFLLNSWWLFCLSSPNFSNNNSNNNGSSSTTQIWLIIPAIAFAIHLTYLKQYGGFPV